LAVKGNAWTAELKNRLKNNKGEAGKRVNSV